MTARMTHNQRVLELLSDGEPHSHLELYDLRVIAHSRVAQLRERGYWIVCWRDDGLHWYQLILLDERGSATSPPVAPLVEQKSGCGRGDSSPEERLPANPGAPEQLVLVAA